MSGQDELEITLASPVTVADALAEVKRPQAFESGDAPHQPEVLAFAAAARVIATKHSALTEDVAQALGLSANASNEDLTAGARRIARQRVELRNDIENIRGMLADHIGEPVPPDMTTKRAVETLLDEIANLKSQLGDADTEANAVAEECNKLATDLGDLRVVHSTVVDSEGALRLAARRVTGLFNRDPEDHQVADVLLEIAAELTVWRADPTRVPDGWRSLVAKGWSVGAPMTLGATGAQVTPGVIDHIRPVKAAEPVSIRVNIACPHGHDVDFLAEGGFGSGSGGS